MNKHEEKVKQRAKEMAIAAYGDCYGFSVSGWRQHMAMARLSVQREAEAYKEGLQNADRFQEWSGKIITEELIERGLIPPQTQTT